MSVSRRILSACSHTAMTETGFFYNHRVSLFKTAYTGSTHTHTDIIKAKVLAIRSG